jgi:hypothetical protein
MMQQIRRADERAKAFTARPDVQLLTALSVATATLGMIMWWFL